jgi:hypothetical protein
MHAAELHVAILPARKRLLTTCGIRTTADPKENFNEGTLSDIPDADELLKRLSAHPAASSASTILNNHF